MYRIGQEEIDAVKNVIETRSLFKINSGLQESKKIEEELTYPGQIKVHLLRETKAIEYAK